MKTIKTLVENFDKSEYPLKSIKDCTHNSKVSIVGVLNIETKKTKAGSDYFNLTISDNTGKISSPAWGNTDLFKFLDISDDGKLVEINGDISISRYTNITINNLSFIEKEETDGTIGELTIEVLKAELEKRICTIGDDNLKKIVRYALAEISDKFEKAPFSEKTAYNYAGGLMHEIIDVCDISSAVVDAINCGFWNESTLLNEDLLLVGAILSNLGKAITLTINDSDIIEKTFEGQLDEDSIYSREIASRAVNKFLDELKESNASNYEDYKRRTTELLHIVGSVKNNVNWGALSVPRSKHAMILSHINNLVYTKGLFESLEKSKNPNSMFTKAYDNGRNYYLGDILE